MMNVKPVVLNNRDALAELRRLFLQVLIGIAIVASVGATVALLIARTTQISGFVISVITIMVSFFCLVLVRYDRIVMATGFLIGLLLTTIWFIPVPGIILVTGSVAILAGAALTTGYIYLGINLVVFARLFVGLALLVQQNGLQPTPDGITYVTVISALIIISSATRLFIDTAERAARSSARTADLLQTTAEIGQITSTLTLMDEIFTRAVELIRDRFAFYHVQIFLVDDERKFARLVASTGEIGQKLMARGHRLAVGSQSVIGRVTQIGETVVASDTDKDPTHAVNELLPNTRSELALPIIDGQRIIGALDVQSTRRDAFTPGDVQALQVMTAQLATVIRNARLFEQQENSVQMNQRLLLEARTNLREIQRLNSQLSKKAWDEYLENTESSVGIKLEANNFDSSVEWTPEMIQAVQDQRPVSRVEGTSHITAIPITLRGEVLGAIEVAAEDMRETELVEMVQAVAQNLAISLDGARLFEEAQEAAAQEQRINAIVERYQAAATVDDLLKITVDELGKTLGSDQAAIRVGALDQPNSKNSPLARQNGKLNGGSTHE